MQRRLFRLALILSLALLVASCRTFPRNPEHVEIPAGVVDQRERFASLFCAVLDDHGASLPDSTPCAHALSTVADGYRSAPLPPLAARARLPLVGMLVHFPGAQCDSGDGQAVASLRPAVRNAFLAANPLPGDLRYYSLVTLPKEDRISRVLEGGHRKLSRISPLNDGQLIYSDQIIPGSKLLAFLNADHWAAVLPIHREHRLVAATLVTRNDYPREALLEALMRFIDEDTPVAAD